MPVQIARTAGAAARNKSTAILLSPISALQTLERHKPIFTTQRYIELNPTVMKVAVELF